MSGQVMARERIQVAFFGVVHLSEEAGDEVLLVPGLSYQSGTERSLIIRREEHIKSALAVAEFRHFCNYFVAKAGDTDIQAENSARAMNPPMFG